MAELVRQRRSRPKNCFLLYVASQVYLFVSTFLYYKSGPNYKTIVSLVGNGIPAAKAAAACLNWDSANNLLPASRTLISKLHVTVLSTIISLKSITSHRNVIYVIVLFTWIHVMAHI
ncbi:hypothetical protein AMAG_16104 [Allomyces macrogynus ATCC 38327]|uniref:Ferric oxidoreductase domain-containing protein n=1 Tax=Allomyces macrogynus (strain ATCC 38327) TaxID=578462 RepID=A0A0L0TAF4_ALLM3|nr:hypothetical protein AMAG_16104 [Allomyces macrogynus ATCC 38327]|eukprot:KNE71798.1 hypothetical protein AMAG_16104 [Allomyces macrogynus ATCC 38327]